MDVAMVGLGRMGGNMARRLLRGGHHVVVWNRTYAKAQELAAEGAAAVRELSDVVAALAAPRVLWLMLPHGEPTQAGHRRAGAAAGRGRHPHRRRQLVLQGRHRPRRRPCRARAALPRRGHQRRRLGSAGRLLHDDRRRAQRLRAHRADARDAGAQRARLRLHGWRTARATSSRWSTTASSTA